MVTIAIKKEEYDRLKKLERTFKGVFGYFLHLQDIEEARKEVRTKKTISQKKLFEKLGL